MLFCFLTSAALLILKMGDIIVFSLTVWFRDWILYRTLSSLSQKEGINSKNKCLTKTIKQSYIQMLISVLEMREYSLRAERKCGLWLGRRDIADKNSRVYRMVGEFEQSCLGKENEQGNNRMIQPIVSICSSLFYWVDCLLLRAVTAVKQEKKCSQASALCLLFLSGRCSFCQTWHISRRDMLGRSSKTLLSRLAVSNLIE